MQRLLSAKLGWLLISALLVIGYFYGLGQPPLIGPDEPRYAQVAREMFTRGDPVTPTLGGYSWFEKPALLYWVMMASYRVFGVSEWSARFGSACAGLLSVLAVGWTGRRIEQSAPELHGLGMASALVLASSAGCLAFSHGASFDILVTTTITASLTCFLASELEMDGRRRKLLLTGFYFGVGLSLLAKGLVGIVIPFGVVALYFGFTRRWPDATMWLSLLWGTLLAASVAATWYWPVIARHGGTFIDEFFLQHHFARYVSDKYHHPQPFYFYVPIILLFAMPWTAFLIHALGAWWRERNKSLQTRGASGRWRVFALAWLVWPVLFFSLSKSKLPGYVLPALPAAALLAGAPVAAMLHGRLMARRGLRATGLLLMLLALGAVIYAGQTNEIGVRNVAIIATPFAMTGLCILLWGSNARMCVLLMATLMLVAPMLVLNFGIEEVAMRHSVRGLIEQADARGYQEAPVFHLHTVEHPAEFYAAGRVAYGVNGKPIKFEGVGQVADAVRSSGGTGLVIVLREYTWQLTEYNEIDTEIIADNGVVALVAVRIR